VDHVASGGFRRAANLLEEIQANVGAKIKKKPQEEGGGKEKKKKKGKTGIIIHEKHNSPSPMARIKKKKIVLKKAKEPVQI